MKNTRIITCALVVAGLLLVGSQVSDRQSRAQGGPPGGISGSVTVANTPLPVTVTNPTIPPSTVNVGNTAALAAANAQALRGTPVSFSISPTGGYSVPLGRNLVIEYVSGSCGTGQAPLFAVSTNGVQLNHALASSTQITSSLVYFAQLVKLYADPGSNISTGSLGCSFSFSGQLVTP